MDIIAATARYEDWVRKQTSLVAADLDRKHAQMAAAVFPFFRATYYRWAELFPKICPDCAQAPTLLAVGDLHMENFGTWRDADGRLVWGVNDFDEVAPLPYTNDLVRLAASVHLAAGEGGIALPLKPASERLLAGYTVSLEHGGRPLVLEEHHRVLRAQALSSLRDPVRFWAGMDALPKEESPEAGAVAALKTLWPQTEPPADFRHRQAGLGSLGRPRVVAIGEWLGGRIAREAKAVVGPASAFLDRPDDAHPGNEGQRLANKAVRCPDPLTRQTGAWLVRRRAPDCSRIELSELPNEKDRDEWLAEMGWETANVHLATPDQREAVLADLRSRPAAWLHDAAHAMAHACREDQAEWAHQRHR